MNGSEGDARPLGAGSGGRNPHALVRARSPDVRSAERLPCPTKQGPSRLTVCLARAHDRAAGYRPEPDPHRAGGDRYAIHTATISRRCSRSSTAKCRRPSAARPWCCGPVTRSTCPCANAPTFVHERGYLPARLLCLCAPSGQEEFFTLVRKPVRHPNRAACTLDEQARDAFRRKAQALLPRIATGLPPPPGTAS